jgi:hypothetical protein
MLYMHDVWVNWFSGEENGYNVCEFEEWTKTDVIELMDQIPLIKVDDRLFDLLENTLSPIPQNVLESIQNKAYLRRNHDRLEVEYSFVATNGKGIVVIDTNGTEIPLKKSRIIPRQIQLVFEMFEHTEEEIYELDKQIEVSKEYNLLNLHPKFMAGLSRREKRMKQILFIQLDSMRSLKQLEKLRYLYGELDYDGRNLVKEMNLDGIIDLLEEKLEKGWTKEYENFSEYVIKGMGGFEKEFNELRKEGIGVRGTV